MRMPTTEVLQALSVTAEVCGAEISPEAARIMAADLAEYAPQAVLDALVRVRRENKGRLSLATIIERIDDGRPGADEAWAMVPKDEYATAVLTDEILAAMPDAMALYGGDRMAARMAFKGAYERIVAEHRAERRATKWVPSLGFTSAGRIQPIARAVELGRISLEDVSGMLPPHQLDEVKALCGPQKAIQAAPAARDISATAAAALRRVDSK